MEEAVEICKLRLFLKLISQEEPGKKPEVLPDIDFNIRAGNTLVGFTSIEEVRQSMMRQGAQIRMLWPEEDAQIIRIIEDAELASRAYQHFQAVQDSGESSAQAKEALKKRLDNLNTELNHALVKTYGLNKDTNDYAHWLKGHKPFHWYVEFFSIMTNGGFNVVIGNPPYIEYKTFTSQYTVQNKNLVIGGNLHSMVFRRCLDLSDIHSMLSMIVPVAIASTDRMKDLRKILNNNSLVWITNYAIRPNKLFDGAEQRLSIVIARQYKKETKFIYTSKYQKWNSEERPYLFSKLSYYKWELNPSIRDVWPKINSLIEYSILQKIQKMTTQLNSLVFNSRLTKTTLFYKNTGIGYFIVVTTKPPICHINGKREPSSRETELKLNNSSFLFPIHCLLNSSLYYLTYQQFSNCRDLNPSDIVSFRIPDSILSDKKFENLSKEYQLSIEENSWFQVRNQKQTGIVQIQSFTPSLSKSIIDHIDQILAEHYGFTLEELDFIINYDIKYRMGADPEDA